MSSRSVTSLNFCLFSCFLWAISIAVRALAYCAEGHGSGPTYGSYMGPLPHVFQYV